MIRDLTLTTLLASSLMACQPYAAVDVASEPLMPTPTATPQGFRQGKASPLPKGIIVEGKSVGPLMLGATYDEAMAALGPTLDEYHLETTQLHWMEPGYPDNGIFAYARDGKLFEIDNHSMNFTLPNGIKNESKPEALKNHYPDLVAYRLLHSGGKVNGGEDIVYWIDNAKGIAFAIYYYANHRRKLVGTIIVFEPQADFRPYEFQRPREWVKIPDWTY